MDTTFPVDYHINELPKSGFTLRGLYGKLIQNLSGSITTGPLSSDLTHFAPQFTGDSWKFWDEKTRTYNPLAVKINNVSITASPTANRMQALQNKAGIIALTDDVYNVRDTVILLEGLVSVDWNIGGTFLCVLSADRQSAFYMTHATDGMMIELLLVNNGTSQVTWDPAITWPAATAPQPATAKAGAPKGLQVILRKIGATIFGESFDYDLSQITTLGTSTGLVSGKGGTTDQSGGGIGHH